MLTFFAKLTKKKVVKEQINENLESLALETPQDTEEFSVNKDYKIWDRGVDPSTGSLNRFFLNTEVSSSHDCSIEQDEFVPFEPIKNRRDSTYDFGKYNYPNRERLIRNVAELNRRMNTSEEPESLARNHSLALAAITKFEVLRV